MKVETGTVPVPSPPVRTTTNDELRPLLQTATAMLLLAAGAAWPGLAKGTVPSAGPVRLPVVDVERLLAEDEANRSRKDLPYRVGWPIPVDLSPADSGQWSRLPGGDRLWSLKLVSEGARWLVLGFPTFRLQPGGELYLSAPTGARLLGPFTSADVRPHGQLWLPPVEGDTVVVELHWPAALAAEEPSLRLGTVSHGYKSWGVFGADTSSSREPEAVLGSGSCNIDINCPLGNDWQDQKRGVVRLLFGGSAFCSGSLINNTANDCTPYVLTARHCVGTSFEAASTTVQFNYERTGCESGNLAGGQTLTGASLVSSYDQADTTLLRLDDEIPAGYGAYFSGWDRSGAAPSVSWAIHHPSCDFKKISFNDDPLINGIHWGQEHWRVTNWEAGTTESCSSGSPLFDGSQRIVGQLHGGTSSCDSLLWDEFGKFSAAWAGDGSPTSQLSFWLDPIGSQATVLDGIDLSGCVGVAADLVYTGHSRIETLGNGNGVLDPGEAMALEIDLFNQGTASASGVNGTLSSSTALLSISSPEAIWPEIPIGTERTSSAPGFEIQLDPAYPCGEAVELTLRAEADGSPSPTLAVLSVETGSPQVTEHLRDDLEGSTAGWTTQALIGTQIWSLSTADSSSPTHSWFVANTEARRETTLTMPTFVNVPPGSVLRFRHRVNTEGIHDGGVLEYSTDGGSVWLDAGSRIVTGAYNSVISDEGSAPLAGRSAWSGDLGGFREVAVDLSGLAGADLDVRWRFGSNIFGSAEGWYVDDIVIDTTSYQCAPQSTLPGEVSAPRGSPLRIDKSPMGYRLDWSAPIADGVASSYRLYRNDLRSPVTAPQCESDLGNGTSLELGALTVDSGFIVVGVNSLGEGPYGADAGGLPRAPAQPGALCP